MSHLLLVPGPQMMYYILDMQIKISASKTTLATADTTHWPI